MTILNRINDGYEYEFMVTLPTKEEDTYWFVGQYTNGFEAERKAIEVHGIVMHNVRIQGRRKK